MSTKLYVGNLPYEVTEATLQTLFEGAGQVSTVTIVRDRATGQARGFAFVEMNDPEEARRAISELDKHQLGGRSLIEVRARELVDVALVDLIPAGRNLEVDMVGGVRHEGVVRRRARAENDRGAERGHHRQEPGHGDS